MDLDRKKLLNLMNRMRSQVTPESSVAECTDVSWTVPRHFDASATERLTSLANVLAEFMQRALRDLCNEELEVKCDAVTEHYASFLAKQIEQDDSEHYFLPLSMRGKGCVGFVDVSLETCTRMIAQVLRDPEGQGSEQDRLSDLEKTILQDVINAVGDSLREGFSTYGEIVFEKTEQIVHGRWPLPFQQLEDMFQISFQAGTAEMPLEISLCLLDNVVDSIAGVSTVQITPEQKQKIPERIIEHMSDATINLSVWLNPSMMKFQDIMTLEKGDFVLLDHKVAMPVNVHVRGKECFKGWPAQSAGCGAIVLTEQNTDS